MTYAPLRSLSKRLFTLVTPVCLFFFRRSLFSGKPLLQRAAVLDCSPQGLPQHNKRCFWLSVSCQKGRKYIEILLTRQGEPTFKSNALWWKVLKLHAHMFCRKAASWWGAANRSSRAKFGWILAFIQQVALQRCRLTLGFLSLGAAAAASASSANKICLFLHTPCYPFTYLKTSNKPFSNLRLIK